MSIKGGSFREFKWAGITFQPTQGETGKFEISGIDYTIKQSPNGDPYAEGESKPGMVSQSCVMIPSEYDTFKSKQDGQFYSGTATTLGGEVVSLNCAIDGEHVLDDGKVEVKLAGTVNVQ